MPEGFIEEPEPNEPVRIPLNGNWAQRIREAGVRAREMQINVPRRRNNVGQVLDTVGVELESIALYKDVVNRILGNLPNGVGDNFKVYRDGSSEINAYFVTPEGRNGNYIMISSHTKEAEELFEGKYNKNTVGYELISVPMDIVTCDATLSVLLPALKTNGDFNSERCATHIHVGGMKNLGFLKNCLKLGLWFDEVFFSLAHLDSDKFRGYSNNAIYARPLVNGPYFKQNRDYYQVLNWQKALKATDLYEFFACYGANVEGDMPKYHPGRYFSINLYSIPRIGTVEFRHFNQSFNPEMISAVAKLCQLFVEVAMRINKSVVNSLEIGDVFTTLSPSYYINKLYKFLEIAEMFECEYSLDKRDIDVLKSIIYTYRGIGVESREVLTHCRDFEIPSDLIELGELRKSKNKPICDGHTDIHNIKYSSIIKE